ncbi:MAG TPA: glycoside hydrolase family 16 protein [Chitinophagaceae bacterium]|nr:glycoside hydrolase family 16 protein [Chitinophagaceae bacterium]
MNRSLTGKSFYWLLTSFLLSCSNKNNSDCCAPLPPPPAPTTREWSFESTPVWADEFTTDGVPDPVRWGYDIGGNGWGNNEMQYYTDGLNSSVTGGILRIAARKETFGGRNYTSSRMITKNKGDWLYGRFEIKAKLPRGRGTWPALWMLPTDWTYGNWPNSGEIDIMEHVGYDQNRVHITVHTKAFNHTLGTQKGNNTIVGTASDEFHRYRVDWATYGIRGYIDDQLIFEFMNQGGGSDYWPFDNRFHLLMNIAVGGSWGGIQGIDDTIFPATMEVDYVRVYKFIK